MATPVRKIKKKKRKLKAKMTKSMSLVKKDSVKNDTIPNAPTRLAPDVAPNFKIRIKRK